MLPSNKIYTHHSKHESTQGAVEIDLHVSDRAKKTRNDIEGLLRVLNHTPDNTGVSIPLSITLLNETLSRRVQSALYPSLLQEWYDKIIGRDKDHTPLYTEIIITYMIAHFMILLSYYEDGRMKSTIQRREYIDRLPLLLDYYVSLSRHIQSNSIPGNLKELFDGLEKKFQDTHTHLQSDILKYTERQYVLAMNQGFPTDVIFPPDDTISYLDVLSECDELEITRLYIASFGRFIPLLQLRDLLQSRKPLIDPKKIMSLVGLIQEARKFPENEKIVDFIAKKLVGGQRMLR